MSNAHLRPCLGPCLPFFLPGSGPGLKGRLGGNDASCSPKREAWLEDEIIRLHHKFQHLKEVNQSLMDAKEEAEAVAKMQHPESEGAQPGQAEGNQGESYAGTTEQAKPSLGRRPSVSHAGVGGEDLIRVSSFSSITHKGKTTWQKLLQRGQFNVLSMQGSAINMNLPKQVLIYTLATAGIVFVLLAAAMEAREENASGDPSSVAGTDTVPTGSAEDGWNGSGSGGLSRIGHGRRLFGAAPSLLKNVSFALASTGFVTLIVNAMKLPLILGYLLGGVLVGPIGLNIVASHEDIAEISGLGLVFLLFMIGMELDIKELLKMGKVVLLTGMLQYPICVGAMYGVFLGLNAMGLSFGNGLYATLYCGLTCGISSTMIVANLLGGKGELGSEAGRLTVGILIFQDIWAIIVLAIQPNLASPEIVLILKTFALIGVLIAIALLYAKFIMPALLYSASKSVELMLVLSLAWCFFICCTAILPFIGLSMELAALIAGVALATFPYSAEFNGKIKYIRDFFITLFFAGLGMQIPVPTFDAIAKGFVIAVIVMIFRWLGIFLIVLVFGGGVHLAAKATINLSQISEFALVICSMGMTFGHVDAETLTIIIWTFSILAILSNYLIGYNDVLTDMIENFIMKIRGKQHEEEEGSEHGSGEGHHHHEERDIVLLGFHRIASMLIGEFQGRTPQVLKRLHIIDVNQDVMEKLREKGVQCTYGDFAAPDVLEHCHHGEAKIVLSTIPDSMLQGVTNLQLLKIAKEVWPKCVCIVTADNPYQAHQLYGAGANYVLRMAKLCAERLHDLLQEQVSASPDELDAIFQTYKAMDKDHKAAMGAGGSQFLSVRV